MSDDTPISPAPPAPTATMTIAKDTNEAGLPCLPLDLRDYKLPIAIQWGVIVLSSGILPIVGYFAMRYGGNLDISICLSPWLALIGVVSVFSLLKRSWFLLRKNSDCRPLGVEQGWKMDYFGWNFVFGFVIITILISLGSSLENLTVVSLPLSILVLYVSLELLIAETLLTMGIRAPFRLSSVARGDPLRPGSYVIVEDVVAVDGKQGRAFRQAWCSRYEASPALQSHLRRMDLLWATTGLAIVAIVWGCVFGVGNKNVGYAIGELPMVFNRPKRILLIEIRLGSTLDVGR